MTSLIHWITILTFIFQGLFPPASSLLQVAQQTLSAESFSIRIHPDQPLEVGDIASFEIFAAQGVDVHDQQITISLVSSGSKVIGKSPFAITGENKFRALLMWAWDTHGLAPGEFTLSYAIQPAGITWQQKLQLNPVPPGPSFKWAAVETACCIVHYITGTRPERDLALLLPEINTQFQLVETQLSHVMPKKVDINLLPRILGQGGFTTDEVYLSDPELNYVDTDLPVVLHHELVHVVDLDIGGKFRPLLLVEGLAVYLTGGHYRTEPLLQRAATLVDSGTYIPLPNLADNFYAWQHEISYLEAGSLVSYMVNAWGWKAYDNFYRDIEPILSASDSTVIDHALQAHFGLSFRQLDDRFYTFLKSIPINPDLDSDVIATADLFDTIRAYQQKLDPTAFFQEVWLPDANQMRERGITADFLRRDETSENIEIEAMLVQAGEAWKKGDFNGTERLIFATKQKIAGG
ncbi:MAG TPA: hypothetical protein VMS73_08155 [Anaerolineaceae bacterium]|nr:hypothetical protein [Anaerolineaceae bacterium]